MTPVRDAGASAGPLPAVVGSLLMLAVVAYGWLLDEHFADFYYRSVQEDEALEWATFWAFVLAAVAYFYAALRQRKLGETLPWFFVCVGLFCVFVAGEEISWGQRVVGYRPPEYFLERNFQQELNLHNIASSDLRRLALKAVILGYGLVLPLLALIPPSGRLLRRLGIRAPSWPLAAGFVGAFVLYEVYPWRFSGEWVELILGLGFLFAALIHLASLVGLGALQRAGGLAAAVAVAGLAVGAVGVAHAALSRAMVADSSELLAAARRELAALQQDFDNGHARSRCGIHKRLYTYRVQYRQSGLLDGKFAGLTRQGLPEARAEFMLDPWNSPYWIRDRCKNGRRAQFIYSFGPDRRRQSSRWEILGDDVGVHLGDSKPR